MQNIYGIMGLQIKGFEVVHEDMDAVNKFLSEHDGNIVSVDYVPMSLGVNKVFIIYKVTED